MNALILPLSILCGLILSGTGVSLFVFYRTHCLLHGIDQRAKTTQSSAESDLQLVRDSVEAVAAQIQELQSQPLVAMAPGLPKPGLNLCKRNQALRMHRHGEPAEKIAASLELPRQEVELLLKVHRILIGSV
jgi:hypothetical protein